MARYVRKSFSQSITENLILPRYSLNCVVRYPDEQENVFKSWLTHKKGQKDDLSLNIWNEKDTDKVICLNKLNYVLNFHIKVKTLYHLKLKDKLHKIVKSNN